jgi:hypothetical protein
VIAAMRRDAMTLLPPVIADVRTRAEQPLLQAITDLETPTYRRGIRLPWMKAGPPGVLTTERPLTRTMRMSCNSAD